MTNSPKLRLSLLALLFVGSFAQAEIYYDSDISTLGDINESVEFNISGSPDPYAGIISDTSETTLTAVTKTGAGTLNLSGASSYTGGTTISAGTLKISNVGALGTGAVTINGGKLDASPVGKSQTIANDLVIGANGGSVATATGDYSSYASISGSGDLTTDGYVHFNGTGGYSGHLTVNSGYTRIVPGAFGIFDLTLNGSSFAVLGTGTIQIGKLEAPNGGTYLFGASASYQYVFEIGAGTKSTDTASYGQAIRGTSDGAYNVTVKKVGAGTQTFNRTGYGYAGVPNSIKEVIVDGGKMIIDADNTSAFAYNKAVGFWGSAPITVNSGATLEFKRAWTVAPNTAMTVNGGTLTLDNTQYINKLTLNSGTVNGGGNIQVGYHGNADWNVQGGSTTINNNVYFIKNDSSTTFTINFDKDATLDVKKAFTGASNYAGMNVTLKGTGDGPGNIILESTTELGYIGNITFDNMKGSVASPITGTATVTKSGAGTVTLAGVNTYTGATSVSGGELVFSGSTLPVSAMTATGGTLVLGTEGNTITVKRGASIKASGGAVRVDGNLVFESAGSGYVLCDGSWTGSGSIKLDGGYIRVGTKFNTTTGINFNGGSILNNNNDAVLASDLTITKDGSTMQAGWKLSLTHTGALKGSSSLTVGSDSGWLIFSGNGSAYTGSLLVKGNMRIGKAKTDSSDVSAYIGGKVINLNGGTIQNNNNNLTIKNDLNVMSETGFKTGWSKSITLTGNVTGSAKLKQVSDSGWLILKTHSDNDAFTGPFQTGWASTDSRGQTKLGVEQPLGANAGVLYNYGYLDMNGFSQKFKGVTDDEPNNKLGRIYNTTANKSTVTFDITSQNLSYGGTIESNVELIVNASGAGTQTFTNNTSSFTGNVTINGGTVKGTTAHKSYTTTDFGAFTTEGGRTITVNSGAELVLGTNDVLGGCSISYFNDNSMRVILNGGKLSGTNNNPLYNATFQNGAEVYGNNNRDIYRSFWLMGPNTVSFAGDGETPENPVQFNGADGVIFVLDSAVLNVADVTCSDDSDLVVNVILGNKSESFITNNSLTKTGAGTMELTKANEYTAGTTISEGVLKFTDAAVVANGPITVGADGTLEYNLSSGKTQLLTIYETEDSNNKITSTGKVVKTGDGTLQIFTAAAGQVDASSFVVSSGRLDMKEYFNGTLEVDSGATMSPGNSIGKLTVDGDFNLNGGTLLMEVAGPTPDDSDQLIVINDGSLIFGEGATIVLDFVNGMSPNAEFAVVIDAPNSNDDWVKYVDASYFTDLSYTQTGPDGRWVLSGHVDANAVPEPSTWALLVLGVALWSATACRRFHYGKRR